VDQWAPSTTRHTRICGPCGSCCAWLALGRPILGVGLDAQLLAAAAGGRVCQGEREEVGVGAVQLTAIGQLDPLFKCLGSEFEAFHWHGDTFELPDDAVRLASTAAYPQQAFRLGRTQYGLQFHVKLTPELLADMAPHLPNGAMPSAAAMERIVRIGNLVLGAFFDLAVCALANQPTSVPSRTLRHF